MRRNVFIVIALLSSAILVACGGGMQSTVQPASVPVTVTIGDTPPSGVAVLFFEATITGASLQPVNSNMMAAAAMLTAPVEGEFSHLQTDTAFLSLTNVTPGTYNGINLTFGNAVLTIVNYSTGAIGSCAAGAVCQLTPSFASGSTTVSRSPFPITIDMNSVVGMKLDLDVNGSVQSAPNTLTINPVVTVTHLTQRHASDEGMEMEDVDDLEGQVTGLAMNQFTLTTRRNSQSFMVNVDGNTTYADFDRDGCTASPEDITCVKMNQILNVRLSETGMGSMLAKRVEFVAEASQQALKGTITSVNADMQHFQMVVFNEEVNVNGITEGEPVTVTIASNASFQVGMEEMGEDGGFGNFGFRFANPGDLLVGQDVQIRPTNEASSNGTVTVTTDLVRLWPSQISGSVGQIDSGNGTFTLTKLSPLFTGPTPPMNGVTPINTITVQMLPLMEFGDFPGQTSLAAGDNVSVKGLLFNTISATGTPTLVTRIIHAHMGD